MNPLSLFVPTILPIHKQVRLIDTKKQMLKHLCDLVLTIFDFPKFFVTSSHAELFRAAPVTLNLGLFVAEISLIIWLPLICANFDSSVRWINILQRLGIKRIEQPNGNIHALLSSESVILVKNIPLCRLVDS